LHIVTKPTAYLVRICNHCRFGECSLEVWKQHYCITKTTTFTRQFA